MKIAKLPNEFKAAAPVIQAITEQGFEAYFVGGSVRDLVTNHPIHDVDIATSAFPEEVKSIFKRTIDVGIEHGTVLVLHDTQDYEITTFRTESAYEDYRRPDEVFFVRTLKEDLKRRDFTMNALAMTLDGEIIDLFNGVEAIKNKQIIAVGDANERFNEDALRMMRALRFSSQLGFDIDKMTKEAILKNHELLEKIAIERIYIEWVKLLMGIDRGKGISLFVETDCYRSCPGMQNKREELLLFSKISPSIKISTEEMSWLCAMISLNVTDVASFLKPWKTSNKILTTLKRSMDIYTRRLNMDWTPEMLYVSGEEVITLVEDTLLFFGYESDKISALERYRKLPIHSSKDLKVNGSDVIKFLGKQPGPWLGSVLNKLVDNVLDGSINNSRDDLLKQSAKLNEEEF